MPIYPGPRVGYAEPILFPDVEAWAVQYLTQALGARTEPFTANVYIGNEVPKGRRPRMVIVRRDGGSRLDLTRDLARLTVRVFGGTDTEAQDLASFVRAFIGGAADGNPVARVREMSGPTPVPDSGTKPSYRLMSFELVVLGGLL